MAKEYIEREAAIEEVDNADVMCDIPPDAYRVLRRYIERIPAADVVARDCFDKILAENDDMRAIIDTYGRFRTMISALTARERTVTENETD